MRTRLVAVVILLVLGVGIAYAAPPTPIILTPGATEIQLTCTATGAPSDGGYTAGATFTQMQLLRLTGADSTVCIGDGGTLGTGCLDGGTCMCSSGGMAFPQGTVMLIAPKDGRSTIGCRGDGGSLSLTPVDFVP